MERNKLHTLLRRHFILILVLIGSFLIVAPMGTYSNWDAQVEYEAVNSILSQGYPYVTSGLMINQPPLGFYISSIALAIIGVNYLNGVVLTTTFGLGCVVALYVLGNVLYGRKTGLAAAALFGFIPWHVYMSRIFLIDNQYLFLSLLFVTISALAIKRNSDKLVLGAGIVFALAFLTKLFAVFAIIPVLLLIILERKKHVFKLDKRKMLLFILPTFIAQIVWFGGFANQNFFGVYLSSDFTHPELVNNPVLEFLPIIFIKASGWLLFIAILLSLGIAAIFRKQLKPFLHLDAVCVGTVVFIAILNMLLVLGFHLTVPYVSALKYNYFSLPFLCLLGASILDKSNLLIKSVGSKLKEWIKLVLLLSASILVSASLVESILFLNVWYGFVSFGVDSVTYYGFYLNSPVLNMHAMVSLHFVGLFFGIAGLIFSIVYALTVKK